ncbi:hypothetical protein OsJ_23946 [Oryza sativa Japonica Group]|uniref:Uncharacterized protein n=1 Tax=Oryza sativa subsp. japonica TaxID=39947 RepID=A3BIX0_ORYSJ|nr:hypothetical protein OsJ_23946 [Oryza sativa Japonica Group]
MSYGEAAYSFAGSNISAESFDLWFKHFYDGFPSDTTISYAYEDFEWPEDLRIDDLNNEFYLEHKKNFISAISPFILPTGVSQCRFTQNSYEFYHPMSTPRINHFSSIPPSVQDDGQPPSNISKSGQSIAYADATTLVENELTLAPSIIGQNAPSAESLLQDQTVVEIAPAAPKPKQTTKKT